MKKSTLLLIGSVVFGVMVVIALFYNYYLISRSYHPITTTRYAGIDKFGIKEIYPTKTGGEHWSMILEPRLQHPHQH